jgi:hypothetical protein
LLGLAAALGAGFGRFALPSAVWPWGAAGFLFDDFAFGRGWLGAMQVTSSSAIHQHFDQLGI